MLAPAYSPQFRIRIRFLLRWSWNGGGGIGFVGRKDNLYCSSSQVINGVG